ncbi:MAG: hypothetical protein V4760_09590, partial [Bdellovibrionota bacterium]
MALSKSLHLSVIAVAVGTLVLGASLAPAAELSRGAKEVMAEEADLYRAQGGEWGRSLRARGQFEVNGAFELLGPVSPAQVFSRGKLVPCTISRDPVSNIVVATRASCDESKRIYIPLTDGTTQPATAVPPGLYILGYENSIYPGYVMVSPGQTSRVVLQQIPIPAGGTVKVFRDLTQLDEQRKIYFTTYLTGKSFFKLGEWSFGDLYIQKMGNTNAPPSLDYSFCEQPALPELTARGERICRAWNQGSFMSVMEMFDFRNDARFYQWEVRKPGKPYAYRFTRLLVAKATTSTRAQFVNVLPGIYGVEVVDAKGVARVLPPVRVGPMNSETSALVTTFGMLPTPETL